jgi:hypothetical protein
MDIRIDELAAALGSGVRSTLIGEFSCELWRLDVRLADGRMLQVALKRPLQMPGRNSLELERNFYRHFATRLAAVPRFLGSIDRIDALLLEYFDDLVVFDWRSGPADARNRRGNRAGTVASPGAG